MPHPRHRGSVCASRKSRGPAAATSCPSPQTGQHCGRLSWHRRIVKCCMTTPVQDLLPPTPVIERRSSAGHTPTHRLFPSETLDRPATKTARNRRAALKRPLPQALPAARPGERTASPAMGEAVPAREALASRESARVRRKNRLELGQRRKLCRSVLARVLLLVFFLFLFLDDRFLDRLNEVRALFVGG